MNPQMVPPPAPPQEMAGTPSPMMAPNNQFFGVRIYDILINKVYKLMYF